jgi:hypothetical protein
MAGWNGGHAIRRVSGIGTGVPTAGRGTRWWCASLALLSVLLTGCASIAAYRAEQTRWQVLADQATTHFKVSAAYVKPVNGSRGEYKCGARTIELGTVGKTRWLLAHELGHHLDGYCGGTVESEMAANVWAVKVLQVWGDSEVHAVQTTVGHLIYLKRLRGRHQLAGHNYCAEAADILRQYPAHADPRVSGDATCADEIATVRP